MTKLIANKISVLLINRGICDKSNLPVIQYGLELIVTYLLGVLCLVIFSLLLGHPFAWFYFILGFAPLRTSAGGYHARTHFGCYLVSTLTYVFCLGFSLSVSPKYFLLMVGLFISFIIICILAPVEAENKPLKEYARKKNRVKSIALIIIDAVISIVFFFSNIDSWKLTLFLMSVFFAVLSLIIAKISRFLAEQMFSAS